ncbi:alpha/beta hydrolase [Lacisediminimonas sp.]|uniref:alpha/beta hydrolase n=1 Tax=Lacisediminimonas sp. TaxID=3060582 RepID=UPI002724AA0F|nr:alpha/beta hydrolase [Lacisediminimonas sp.]MDO8299710.1 alpha/beta hydrolase [Lacisediminimonas sp.]MDO9217550.1 alpha/beta hydrolase [Lacisediminimonas sp.]
MENKLLFRGYDRAGLDREYDNRNKVPGFDFASFLRDCEQKCEAARASHDCVLDLPYGDSPAERLDIFRAPQPDAPVHVFFHGGYWRLLDKKDFSYIADGFVPQGVTVVVVNYALMPGVTMDELIAQCRRSLHWVASNIARYGGDPARISISGHSAGGHIAAMMLASAGMPAMTHACAISGIFELEPIRLCFLNETLHLQPEHVARNSPRCLPRLVWCPLTIAVGEHEGDEYLRQAREFGAAWRGARDQPRVLVLPGVDHFSARWQLGDPGSTMIGLALGRA